MSRYKAYPEYKDSGVEWVGAIPNSWDVSPLFSLASTDVLKNDDGAENNVLSLSYGRIIRRDVEDNHGLLPESFNTYQLVAAGDIILRLTDLQNDKRSLRVGLACEKGIITSAYLKLTAKQIFLDRYLYRLLHSYDTTKVFYGMGGGLRQSMKFEEMRRLQMLCPSLDEQKQIADFLDHETAKIDALIEKQQRLIELLKEKRQAVISHAVTKGLNPNVPMKDSGVEWLGEVPAHWEIRAVSKLSEKITNGYVGPTRDILVAEGVPYIQATHIKKGKVNFDGAYFVRTAWSNQHSKSILQNGDVLIVQTGAGTGDIGLVTDAEAGFNCHALIIVQPNQNVVSGEFLSMLFQSQYGYSVLYSIRTGGMHPHLNCGEVQYVRFPVPPRVEQAEILAFISSKTKTFDALINSQNTAIELMQERRTALISAAVTGKIDVRDWQAAA
jgi:type I restriction enzyme S subunit